MLTFVTLYFKKILLNFKGDRIMKMINKWKCVAITAFCFITALCSGSQAMDDSLNLTEKASQSSKALYESQVQEGSLSGTGVSQARLIEQQENGMESQRFWSSYLSSYLETPIKAGVGAIASGINFTIRNPGKVMLVALLASAGMAQARSCEGKAVSSCTSGSGTTWCAEAYSVYSDGRAYQCAWTTHVRKTCIPTHECELESCSYARGIPWSFTSM